MTDARSAWRFLACWVGLTAPNLFVGSQLVMPAKQWRIEVAQRTVGPWFVTEMALYSDDDCSVAVMGGTAIPASAGAAFDGKTGYYSARFQSSCDGCEAGEAWVGLDFSSAVQVRCARIHQSGANALSLMGTDGSVYGGNAVFFNVYDGVWTTLREPDRRSVFQLANAKPMDGRWTVHELKFFSDDSCTQDLTQDGVTVPWSAGAAFDGSADSHTASFQSLCDGCAANEAWVGKAFDTAQDVRCVRAITSGASSVSLMKWDAASGLFETLRTWDVFHGVWNTLSISRHRSAYVLSNSAGTPGHFSISGLQLYTDAGCTQEVAASGVAISNAEGAVTVNSLGRLQSFQSPCDGCAIGDAWVGRLFDAERQVHCIKASAPSEVSVTLRRWLEPANLWQTIAEETLVANTWATIPVTTTTPTPATVATTVTTATTSMSSTTVTTAGKTTTTMTTTATTTTTHVRTASPTATSSTTITSTTTTTTVTSAATFRGAAFLVKASQSSSDDETNRDEDDADIVRASAGDRTPSSSSNDAVIHALYLSTIVCLLIVSGAFANCALKWWQKANRVYQVHSEDDAKALAAAQEEQLKALEEVRRLKKRVESAEGERDLAANHAATAEQKALHYQQELAQREQREQWERSSSRSSPSPSSLEKPVSFELMYEEIDEKVAALRKLPQDQRGSKLRKLKAHYHPDFQRVKGSAELAGLHTRLSQYLGRYCEGHLELDCAWCANAARTQKAADVW